jgi:uncharacterized protein
MQSSLAITALLMGLVGGPHCVAMCGAACAGIGQAAGERSSTAAMWTFQLGRVLGYAALGGAAAASMQGVGWLSTQSVALRPVWTLLHLAALVVGLVLLWQAQQPVWLEHAGKKIWLRVKAFANRWGRGAPLVIGMLWAFLPCGLLYSAVLVAGLTSHPLQGAAVMALFALGTSVSMMLGPWLWLRLRGTQGAGLGAGRENWGVRLAGLALALSSGWALWMGLVHNTAPWCLTP